MEVLQTIWKFCTSSLHGFALFCMVLPLFSFFMSMLLKSNKLVHTLALVCVGISFLASAFLVYRTSNACGTSASLPWLEIGTVQINFSIHLDAIAAQMLSMVSLITFLVLLFSTDYMKGEKRYNYFFAYISLFAFAMFGLILSRNLLWTYIFWEMVGFCSYLLIGFYTTKQSAIFANKKAFIINRIGDLGFLAGLMMLLTVFRTFDLHEIGLRLSEHAGYFSASDKMMLHYAGYAFFIAVIAKSAQFPLHVWLPNAMEGPTPVSALIHAATMVISGVYLLIRIYFLLEPSVLNLIAFIGAFTALMGAFIAGRQFDIKKILAYSTISQLGYMVMAIGVAAPMAAYYHLITHAFFKAALFLAAGNIIHNLHTQDIREMKGVRKLLPFTFYVYIIAASALVGVPFFSGFFSKEAILNETYVWSQSHSGVYKLIPLFAFTSVIMTAFYVFRHVSMVFFSPSSESSNAINEPIAVRIPLFILAMGSIYMYPLFEENAEINFLPYLTVGLILIGFLFAYLICYRKIIKPFNEQNLIYKLSYNAFYLDVVYDYIFIRPTKYLLHKLQPVDLKFDNDIVHGLGNVVIHFSHFMSWVDVKVIDGGVDLLGKMGMGLANLSAWIDKYIIDGIVNGVALLTKRLGDLIRAFQTGKVQSYFALSALLLILFIWLFMKGN